MTNQSAARIALSGCLEIPRGFFHHCFAELETIQVVASEEIEGTNGITIFFILKSEVGIYYVSSIAWTFVFWQMELE